MVSTLFLRATLALIALALVPPALAQAPTQQQKLLREIYQELVEINTTDSAGDNTQAARAMAARLKAGGYADADLQIIVPPGGPKKGNLVARLKGSGAKKPLLLLAHLDVVEAKREDWERDPFRLIEVTRAYFERASALESGQVAADMKAILRDPPDPQALARLGNLPAYNALFRTTCVATMLEAGHATNALPQRARGVVNCRILPGEPVDEVEKTLVRVLADDKISIKPDGVAVLSPTPPLTPEIMTAVTRISSEIWPGIPVIPTMLVAATDGRFLNNAGIYTYGISGMFHDIAGSGAHGLNERIRVKSLYDGQEFLYRLVKALGS